QRGARARVASPPRDPRARPPGEPVRRRRHRAADGVARLPGGAAADHQRDHELHRADHRRPRAAQPAGDDVSSQAVNPFGSTGGRARRRRLVGKTMEVLATLAALLAIVVLIIVVGSVLKRGFPALSSDFFTKSPAPFGQENGGIANAIVGTVIMTAIATAIAVPVGVLTAIFTSQFAHRRLADFIRLMLNVLAGVPHLLHRIVLFRPLPRGHRPTRR